MIGVVTHKRTVGAGKEYAMMHRLAGLAALAAAGLIVPFTGSAVAGEPLADYREQGSIRAAFVDDPPFGFLDQQGKPTGEAVEVTRAVMERLGIDEVRAMMTKRASLIPGIEQGRWDMIAGGLRITPETCGEVLFSRPTYRTGQAFLVAAGNPHRLNSYSDLQETTGTILGVVDGSVQRKYARIEGIADTRVEEFGNDAEMLAALKGGRIDAAASTRITIQQLARRGGDAVQSAEPFITPPYGFIYGALAFAPEQRELRAAVNEVLDDFLGSDEHLESVAEFNLSRVNIPGPRETVDELCARDVPTAAPQ